MTAPPPGADGQVALDHDSVRPEWLTALLSGVHGASVGEFTTFRPPRRAQSRPAAVLMLFGAQSGPPEVLLIQRSDALRSHAGQVAFPGGTADPDDADPPTTALREATEETGVDPAGVEVVSVLPTLWLPASNHAVTPVLAWWHTPSPIRPVDPAETFSVHLVPVPELLDPANRVSYRHPSGYAGPGFHVAGLTVWGFTAGLLSHTFRLAGWERPWDASRVLELPDGMVRSSLRDLQRGEVE